MRLLREGYAGRATRALHQAPVGRMSVDDEVEALRALHPADPAGSAMDHSLADPVRS